MKHFLPESTEANPFEHCKLERGKYAEPLTQIVSKYKEGFVLALNNEWGGGKTTFVKMWEKYLNKEKFKTIYFNAWENDFDSNPLVPLISELKNLNPKGDKDFLSNPLVKKAAVLTTSLLPVALKAAANFFLGKGIGEELVEAFAKSGTDILQDEIKNYSRKKEGIKEFQIELEIYLKTISPDKPVIFILDELDRCRPTYAVEVLEQVKHFFSVKGIVFVLAIDKQQLENSIKGFYGSNEIDAKGYLKRFIDLEFNLPKPNIEAYIMYLYDFYELDKFFEVGLRIRSEFVNDKNVIIEIATSLSLVHAVSLRDIEKLFINLRLTLLQFEHNSRTVPNVLFFLIFMRSHFYSLYKEIKELVNKPEDLILKIESQVIIDRNFNDREFYTHLIFTFLFNYNKAYQLQFPKYELHRDNRFLTGTQFSRFKPGLEALLPSLSYYRDCNVDIRILIGKIDMTTKLVND